MRKQLLLLCLLVAALLSACQAGPTGTIDIQPTVATEPVTADPDDPAIYVHPEDPARSLVLGTNKVAAPQGALVVFGLDGKIRQTIAGLDRPNNVDIEYGLVLGGNPVDIAVLTERLQQRLRVFLISPDGVLSDVSSPAGLRVLAGREGEATAPMGISLYKRPADGAIFAVVAPKTGPREGYLCQYRLSDDGTGRVKAEKVREFGRFSGTTEIEAVAVDDALGYIYYADEGDGIHKYHADPDHPDAARELAHFARSASKPTGKGSPFTPARTAPDTSSVRTSWPAIRSIRFTAGRARRAIPTTTRSCSRSCAAVPTPPTASRSPQRRWDRLSPPV